MTTISNGSVDTVTVNTGAMSKALHKLAERDVISFRSSREIRQQLMDDLFAAGYTSESCKGPARGEKPSAFYTEMMALSRDAVNVKRSDKGLTDAEKAELIANGSEDGCYSVETITSPDIKPSDLPAWANEANRIGKLSPRRYFQQQMGQWLASVKSSMEKREQQIALVTGGASARTKTIAERDMLDLAKLVNRERASETPALKVNELNYIIKVVDRLADENELKNPLAESED